MATYNSSSGLFTYIITNTTSYIIEQQDYDIIESAFNRWDDIVNINPLFGDDYTIIIAFDIDLLDEGILGGAGINTYSYIAPLSFGKVAPYEGTITMNSLYLQSMKTTVRNDGKTSYYYVLLHEIGHILGIGNFWSLPDTPKVSYDDNGSTKSYYTGVNALREYKNYFSNSSLLGIPIEDNGGPGTAGGHPEEGDEHGVSTNTRYIDGILHPGLDTELMTGWLDSTPISTPLSRITIGFLEDLGYQVNYNLADVYIMSWLATNDANNLEQTYIEGFLDVSGGNIINRKGNVSVMDGNLDVNGNATFTSKLAVGSSTLPTGNTSLKVSGNIDFTGGSLQKDGVEIGLDILSDVKAGGTNFTNSLLIGHNNTGTLTSWASNNTGVGKNVFNALTEGGESVAVGYNALTSNTSGGYNVGIGSSVLATNSTGNHNVASGYKALNANDTGGFNVATGNHTLSLNQSGGFNVATGYQALQNNLGSHNVAIGNESGKTNSTGTNNTYIGSLADAAAGQTALDNSTAIGYNAKATASNQIMLGTSVETVVIPGKLDVVSDISFSGSLKKDGVEIGLDILSDVKFGGAEFTNSLLIGNTTTGSLSSADGNTGVGGQCLLGLTTGKENTSVGLASSKDNTTGSYNVTVGGATNFANQTGSKNTMLGHQAGRFNTTDNGVAVGYRSLYKNTSGSNNTAIGFQSLFETSTGSDNTCVGYEALNKNTTGGQNTASGSSALKENTTGAYNSAYGYMSLNLNETGHRNTATGRMSLYKNVEGAYNTAVGMSALFENNTGENNSACGYMSLYANTTGNYNTAVGQASGNVNTTGFNNTYIGAKADAIDGETGLEQSTAIGYNSKATASYQIMLGTASDTVVAPGRVDICGNLYAHYPEKSIPAAAIDGQVEATPNFSGDVAFAGKIGVGSSTTPLETDAALKVTGDIEFTGILKKGGIEYVSGATSLDGLSDVISGGTNFSNGLLIGHSSTGSLNDANNNIGVGAGVFGQLTEGDNNTGMGFYALSGVTTGIRNTGFGRWAIKSVNTGTHNTAIGADAGTENTHGSYNTYIGTGANAGTDLSGLEQSTAIGFNAIVTASNQIMLGRSTETVVAPGRVDICGNLYAQYDEANPSIPAGAIIGGVGSNHFTGDVSMNNNLQVFENVTINPVEVTTNVPGIQNIGEYLKFTIPVSMTALKYFCTRHSTMLADFTLGEYSISETDKTYYVTVTDGAVAPYYLFRETPGGIALSDPITLYKGNTYTFIKADTNTTHPFSVGDTHNVTNDLKLESTGSAETYYTVSKYTNPYPLHVNGMVNIENNLSVARTLNVSGPIRQW